LSAEIKAKKVRGKFGRNRTGRKKKREHFEKEKGHLKQVGEARK